MKFARTELAHIIDDKMLETADVKLLAKEIAAYLMEQNRVHDLDSLMRDVMAYRESKGIVEAEIAAAHELEPHVLQEVKTLIKAKHPEAKQVIVHEHIDRSVIGGLRVTLANEQLDMSVRSKLDAFKRLTTEGNL